MWTYLDDIMVLAPTTRPNGIVHSVTIYSVTVADGASVDDDRWVAETSPTVGRALDVDDRGRRDRWLTSGCARVEDP